MKKLLKFLFVVSDDRNIGLLLLRIFVGAGIASHGFGKMFSGPERWQALGRAVGKIGLNFAPTFWGFLAAFAEFFGGIFLALGLFTTVSSFLILCTMLVAAFVAHKGASFTVRELALFYLVASFFFMVKGAGRYSIDRLIKGGSGGGKSG